jgi:hypothetical protein
MSERDRMTPMAARAARVTWLVAALPCVCRCKASVASSRPRVCCRVCSCAACHAPSGLTTATFDEWSNVSGGWGWKRCGGRGCGEAGVSVARGVGCVGWTGRMASARPASTPAAPHHNNQNRPCPLLPLLFLSRTQGGALDLLLHTFSLCMFSRGAAACLPPTIGPPVMIKQWSNLRSV